MTSEILEYPFTFSFLCAIRLSAAVDTIAINSASAVDKAWIFALAPLFAFFEPSTSPAK